MSLFCSPVSGGGWLSQPPPDRLGNLDLWTAWNSGGASWLLKSLIQGTCEWNFADCYVVEGWAIYGVLVVEFIWKSCPCVVDWNSFSCCNLLWDFFWRGSLIFEGPIMRIKLVRSLRKHGTQGRRSQEVTNHRSDWQTNTWRWLIETSPQPLSRDIKCEIGPRFWQGCRSFRVLRSDRFGERFYLCRTSDDFLRGPNVWFVWSRRVCVYTSFRQAGIAGKIPSQLELERCCCRNACMWPDLRTCTNCPNRMGRQVKSEDEKDLYGTVFKLLPRMVIY